MDRNKSKLCYYSLQQIRHNFNMHFIYHHYVPESNILFYSKRKQKRKSLFLVFLFSCFCTSPHRVEKFRLTISLSTATRALSLLCKPELFLNNNKKKRRTWEDDDMISTKHDENPLFFCSQPKIRGN